MWDDVLAREYVAVATEKVAARAAGDFVRLVRAEGLELQLRDIDVALAARRRYFRGTARAWL